MCVVLVRCSVFRFRFSFDINFHNSSYYCDFLLLFSFSDSAVRCSNIQQHRAIDCLALMSRCTLCAYLSYFCFLIPIQQSKWCYTTENPHYSIETCLTYIRVCFRLNLKKIFFSFFSVFFSSLVLRFLFFSISALNFAYHCHSMLYTQLNLPSFARVSHSKMFLVACSRSIALPAVENDASIPFSLQVAPSPIPIFLQSISKHRNTNFYGERTVDGP